MDAGGSQCALVYDEYKCEIFKRTHFSHVLTIREFSVYLMHSEKFRQKNGRATTCASKWIEEFWSFCVFFSFLSSFLLVFTAVIVETMFLLQRLPAVDFKYSYLVTNVYHSICVDPTYNVRSATQIHVMHGEIKLRLTNDERIKRK